MQLASRLWGILSSRRLSVWLMALLAAGYAVWVVPFQVYGVPTWRVRNIATAWGFQALAIALLVNTLACLVAHSIRVSRRVRGDIGPSDEMVHGAGATDYISVLSARDAARNVARSLRLRGFSTEARGRVLRAQKGRFSPVGTILSHLAIVLVAVSVLATANSFFLGKMVLVEGEGGNAADRAMYAEPPADEILTVPDRLMPVGDIELVAVHPGFWRDVQLFNRLEARLRVNGRSELVRINRPTRVGDAWVAVSGFGYAPEIRLERPDGTVEDVFVKLKVFPPGSIDRFELSDTPYRVDMKVFSDAAVVDDAVENRSYNLRDPAIVLRVTDITQSEEDPAFEGILRPGEPAEFGGYTLRIPTIRYYAELRVVRNDGAYWFVAALLCAALGFAVRILFRQRVVLVSIEPESSGSRIRVLAVAEQWRMAFSAAVNDAIARAVSGEPLPEGDSDAD